MSGHSHAASHDHGHAQQGHTMELDTRLLMRWFVGILLFVVGLVLLVSIYFISVTSRMRAERIETTASSTQANATKAAADAVLGVAGNPPKYSWVDAKDGTIQIPIQDAMKKYVAGHSGK
jgi:hypothetical protein